VTKARGRPSLFLTLHGSAPDPSSMIAVRSLLVIGSFFALGSLCASQQTDLAFPSQAIRDTAAKALRVSYVPSSRTNWDSLVASIRFGDGREDIEKRMRFLKITPGGVDMGPSPHAEAYRLDDRWVLIWPFRADGSKSVVQHYGPDGVEGEDTGYFPSGREVVGIRSGLSAIYLPGPAQEHP
jgi:hypothetical protein